MAVSHENYGKCERCNRRVRMDTDAQFGGLWNYAGKWYDYYCYQIVVGIFPSATSVSKVKYDDPKMNPLSVPQAAERLNLSTAMVRRHCQHGTLPAVKVGSTWIIDKRDLEKFAGKPRRRGPKSKPR